MSNELSFYALNKPQQAEVASFYQLYLLCFNDDPAKKWSARGFEQILSLEGVGAHLCAQANDLSGFIIWRITCDECEILNIGVNPKDRRLGIGAKLLGGMMSVVKKEGVKKFFLEVRKTNNAAQMLYANNGFEVTGIRKEYYNRQNGGREDAIIMSKLL